ncbi:MAG: type II secretion system protein F, partial [Micrococcales bacterium]
KLGLIAPWAIVLLLSRRRENLGIYNSPTGLLVLCGGLAVCLIAYFMIQILGAELKAKRVFEDAK